MIPHVIPIGGDEPHHVCHLSCWCFPLEREKVVIHNAKDCREAHERRTGDGIAGKQWVRVMEFRP